MKNNLVSKYGKTLTLAIPVRNEEDNIAQLEIVVTKLVNKIEKLGLSVSIIVNDNFSTDNSLVMLKNWEVREKRLTVHATGKPITFQQSLLQMMKISEEQMFAIFQSDMQDPADTLLEMIELHLLTRGIVGGVIQVRDGNFLNRFVRKLFYLLLTKVSDGSMVIGLQDFYVLPKPVYKELAKLSPEGLFLRGHIANRFGQMAFVNYQRNPRIGGNSNFDFPKMYSFALDGLLLFGTKFIRMISITSFTTFIISLSSIIFWLIAYILGFRAPVQGFTSLFLGVLIMISILGMGTGLILEFLIRIYRGQILGYREY